MRHNPGSNRVVTQPTNIRLRSRRFEPQFAHFGAAAGGSAKILHTRIRTQACAAGLHCVTIGPPAVLTALCVPLLVPY